MARRVVENLIDDVDGSEAAETVVFAVDGVTHEIDLSEENARKLRESVQVFVNHARRVGGRRPGRPAASSVSADKIDNAAVRKWAEENGKKVSERGRIANSLIQEYLAATK
ncbi:Lsr2 family protein [Kineococcus sp. T13]|uniref:histone-like nucleoid-structuring protein Lsr2 n=1 Tax=Kineococcus vitellinus TaxID=2696565 RepID=UPI0014133338|nr:Lsr2 family protein [Kineococcus vitellinus]NAZ73916.1 Lsr2 family protein [Kineococcus vitellinus]